jgi:hypothetical protein
MTGEGQERRNSGRSHPALGGTSLLIIFNTGWAPLFFNERLPHASQILVYDVSINYSQINPA